MVVLRAASLSPPFSGDPAGLPKQACDNGARSANQSPQSVGSSGIDSGVESTSDGLRDLPSIAISLCGGLSDHRDITKGTGLYGTAPSLVVGQKALELRRLMVLVDERTEGSCSLASHVSSCS